MKKPGLGRLGPRQGPGGLYVSNIDYCISPSKSQNTRIIVSLFTGRWSYTCFFIRGRKKEANVTGNPLQGRNGKRCLPQNRG